MTILRVGTNEKYADGWEAAFGKGKKKRATGQKATGQKATGQKKRNKKQAGKSKSGKK